MALTPEQIQSSLKTIKPSQITRAKTPLVIPSTTTPTTSIMPQVTQVQPLQTKQNIMSPSLEVQAGVQPEKDYKKLATPQEISTFAKMIRAGEDPEQAKRGMQKVIDRRLTQENNARGQEPKNYVMTPEMFQAEQNTPIKNFAGGAISEFTDIGRKVTSYLDNPAEMIARGLSSNQGQVTKNIQAIKEREKTPIGARLTGGDPESGAYKAGEIGADFAMTAVTPQVLTQAASKLPIVAKALQASPKLTKIGQGVAQGLESAAQFSAIADQRLPNTQELAIGGAGGAVFSALPMVPELVSNNIVKPVQKYFGKKAEELAVRGLVNVNDAKVIVKTLKETGEGDVGTLGRRGLSRKIAGNNTEDAVAKLENISKTNYDGVRKEVTTVSNKLGSMGVDDVVDNAMTMVGKNVEAINTKAGYTAVDNSEILAIQKAARNGTITLEQKQRSKELIDKFVNIYKRSGDVADTQIADVADELRKSIKNGIEDAVDIATNGKVNIREMNREVAVAEAFKKGIETKAVANELRQYVMQGIQGSIAGGVSNQGDFSTPEGWLKFLGGAFLGRQFGKMMSDPKYVGKLAKVVDYLSAGTRESILNYIKNPKVVKLTENQLSELLNVRNAIKSITKGTQDDLLSNIQNAGDNIPMRTTPVPSSPSSFPIVPVKKATPITPTGVVQEATPNAPLPTAVPKKTIVEKGRATHNPYKTVTMDTKVVAPKTTPVVEPLQTPVKPKNTTKKTQVVDTATAPKKQTVLPKPQEKQAVLEGNKGVLPKAKELAKVEPVSKELQPLYDEAKKYKSADEFMEKTVTNISKKDKGEMSLLHGSNSKGFSEYNFDLGQGKNETSGLGMWLTDDRNVANSFVGKGGGMQRVKIDLKNPKIYTQGNSTKINDRIGEIRKEIVLLKDDLDFKKQLYKYKDELPVIEKKINSLNNEKLELESSVDSFDQMMRDRDIYVDYGDTKINNKKGAWSKSYIAKNTKEANKMFIEQIKKEGYDGIIIKNTEMDAIGGNTNQVIVFDKNTIKKIEPESQLRKIREEANRKSPGLNNLKNGVIKESDFTLTKPKNILAPTKDLQPLYEEARKYKSARDFSKIGMSYGEGYKAEMKQIDQLYERIDNGNISEKSRSIIEKAIEEKQDSMDLTRKMFSKKTGINIKEVDDILYDYALNKGNMGSVKLDNILQSLREQANKK